MSLRPPSGATPPAGAEIDGRRLDLTVLAAEVRRRFYAEYPDEHERHGTAGADWCLHDNQWVLFWAVADVRRLTDLEEQACWLARVLHGRNYPVDRLVRDLQLASDVMSEGAGARGPDIAARLRKAAAAVEGLGLDAQRPDRPAAAGD